MAVSGSVWVEGDYIKWVDADGVTRMHLGTKMEFLGGTPGSLWVQGEDLTYIDQSGYRRICRTKIRQEGMIAIKGSFWLERSGVGVTNSGVLHYISDGLRKRMTHSDSNPHSDGSDHGDGSGHNDTGSNHGDHFLSHSDQTNGSAGFSDHQDIGGYHSDGAGTHSDSSPHSDGSSHGDGSAGHSDSY